MPNAPTREASQARFRLWEETQGTVDEGACAERPAGDGAAGWELTQPRPEPHTS